jgi:thiamine-phosphate pyrophosphorylase
MARLYAIVGSLERARFMLGARVPYLQLRFKDRPLEPHREEISGWPARFPDTRLIINDDMDFAIRVGAWGVHLGQEDLLRYAPAQLRDARLKLGVSTHDEREIARALELGAALIGFGPIFATGTKALTHAPQGLARLREVVLTAPVPVIAIGGIHAGNAREVADTGVALIAMISGLEALTTAAELQSLMDSMA